MRLIDADALYELLDNGFDVDIDELPETKAALLKMIEQQPTVQPEPQWIPCSERLPGKCTQVILRTIKENGWNGKEYRIVDIGTYNTNSGCILAWMPLPTPWKGDRK